MLDTWWKKAVMYQIYPRSFYDSNGDGIGDLKGIIEKLPYLKELGITGIWICPFYPSPMKDNGYDISDYYGIHKEFGTMKDMDLLLQRAKELEIHIITDMVLNHTSNQHEWFLKACEDKESPYRDYYIFKDNIEGMADLRSNFGGSTWQQIEDGSYYFHTFAPEQPDLNWECKQMRDEIKKMLCWWLEKGVSGFRMDAITFIKKDLNFTPMEADGADGRTDVAKACLNQPGINQLLSDLKQSTYGKYQAMTVAEAPGVPEAELEGYIGNEGHFSMIFDFSYTDIDLVPGQPWHVSSNWTFAEFKKKIFDNQRLVQATGWAANYLENHDQPRSIDKYFRGRDIVQYHNYMATVLGTLFFFLRGTPFIYQGEEIGMSNGRFSSIDEFDDINTKDQYERGLQAGLSVEQALEEVTRRSRDQSRTPMQWDATEHAGFTTGTPWLRCQENYREQNVARQIDDSQSVYHYYKKMIVLRNHLAYQSVFIYGNIEEIKTEQENLIMYRRYDANQEIFIYLNLGQEAYSIPKVSGKVLLDNYGLNGVRNITSILPYEAIVWVKQRS